MRHSYLLVLLGLQLLLAGCPPATDDDSAPGDDDASGDDDDTTGDDDTGDDDTTGDDDDTLPTYLDGNLFACMGGGTSPDFTPEYNEEDCLHECDSNTAPVLDAPAYRVNGYAMQPQLAQVEDVVEVLMAYEDTECNLKCGSWNASYSTPEEAVGDSGSLPSNLPCDTASSVLYFGFQFEITEPGDYSWMLRLIDECGAESVLREDAFAI